MLPKRGRAHQITAGAKVAVLPALAGEVAGHEVTATKPEGKIVVMQLYRRQSSSDLSIRDSAGTGSMMMEYI